MLAVLMMPALLGTVLVVFWIKPLSVLSAIERFTPNIIFRVRTRRPLVALSFDDGPPVWDANAPDLVTFSLSFFDSCRASPADI